MSARKNIKSKFQRRFRKVGLYARDFGTASVIKKFTTKYPKYSFIRTTGSSIWKKKCNDGDRTITKRIGRLNQLDFGMLKKKLDIALVTRMAGGVINRHHLTGIAEVVIRANNVSLLTGYGGDLVLTDK